jgi:hypothetical protein
VLSSFTSSYYVGNGDNDYARILNFDPNYDVIQFNGTAADYTISFSNGITSVYRLTPTGSDLIAKIDSTYGLNLGTGFSFVGGSTL